MLTRTAPRSTDPYIDSLLWFDIWDGLTITFSFPNSRFDYSDYGIGDPIVAGFSSFTEMQKQATRYILQTISTFTNLVFVEAPSAADADATLRFANTTATDTGFAFLPSTDTSGGDTWMSSSLDLTSPIVGNFAFLALMHEIGHALGLDHPHEAEASGKPMPLDRDWMFYTVMSYRSYEGGGLDGYTNADGNFAQTYMIEDIAALQAAYGANYAHNSGDTFYFVDVDTGELYVDGVTEPKPVGNTVFRTLWDGGGVDMIDFANFTGAHTSGMSIDLRPGGIIDISFRQRADLGDAQRAPGNIVIPHLFNGNTASLIENVRGSTENDLIHGNQLDNRIDGHNGDDEIYGHEGNDHLIGWDGSDVIYGGDGDDVIETWAGLNRLYGEGGNDTITGGFQADRIFGGDGDDVLHGELAADYIEGGAGNDRIFGGDMRDELFGNEDDDYIEGGLGNDIIDGGTGADTMIGGGGSDRYSVDHVGDTVIELLDSGLDDVTSSIDFVLPDHVETLWLAESGAIRGTGNDQDNGIVGNSNDNILDGGGGADGMAGHGGNDIYYVDNVGDRTSERPNEGIDTVYASVSYVLTREYTERCTTCASVRDRVVPPTDIEFLYLTGTADIDATGNEIANNLIGNAGANVLTGMEGDDTLDGGEGVDTAVFSGNFADYVIEYVSESILRIIGNDGTDTVTNIEFASFDDQSIALTYRDPLATTSGDDFVTLTSISTGGSVTQIDALEGTDTLDATGVFAGAGFMWWRSWENGDDFVGPNTITVADYELTAFEIIFGSDLGDNNFFLPSYSIALTIHGGGSDDTFYTNADTVDTVYGHAGNDLFEQRGGDIAYGGLGDDTFKLTWDGGLADGEEGSDLLISGLGATIDLMAGFGRGPHGPDMVLVSIEHVEVWAVDGYNTTVYGDDGANRFYTKPLHDTGGSVFYDGRGGDDQLSGSSAADILIGGAGNDLLDGGSGDDTMAGGLGDDTFYIDSVFDVVSENAGEGFDRLLSSINLNPFGNRYPNIESFGLVGAARALHGTNNGEEILANPDVGSKLFGYGGADTLRGAAQNDLLYGGFGNDLLIGGAGRDLLDGQAGADDMRGGAGNDNYIVNDAGDIVTELADEGRDYVRSFVDYTLGDHVEWLRLLGGATLGQGNDLDNNIVTAGGAAVLRGFGGNDFLRGSQQDDRIDGGSGNDEINGLSGIDRIFGGTGNDNLNGSNGDDIIDGGAGDDVIFGGRDNDMITGGAGFDTMRGDSGADTFVFDDSHFAGLTDTTADRITDFDQAEGDVIDLSAVDAITGGGDDAFTFIGDAAFSGTAGELRFEQSGGVTMVFMDLDGDAVADHAIALTGPHTLTEADFVL